MPLLLAACVDCLNRPYLTHKSCIIMDLSKASGPSDSQNDPGPLAHDFYDWTSKFVLGPRAGHLLIVLRPRSPAIIGYRKLKPIPRWISNTFQKS